MSKQAPIDPKTGKYSFLVDPDEDIIFELNRGLIDKLARFLSGSGSVDEREIITNKRLYYYNRSKYLFNSKEVITTLDLEDITATDMTAYNKTILLFIAALFSALLICGLLSVVGLVISPLLTYAAFDSSSYWILIVLSVIIIGISALIAFLKGRDRFFVVHYAGGELKFNLRRYSMDTVRTFQRQLYHSKAELEKK